MNKLQKGIVSLMLLAGLSGCGNKGLNPDTNQNNQQNQIIIQGVIPKLKFRDFNINKGEGHTNKHEAKLYFDAEGADSIEAYGFCGEKDYSTSHKRLPYSDSLEVRLANGTQDVKDGIVILAARLMGKGSNFTEIKYDSITVDTKKPDLGLEDKTIYDKKIVLLNSLGDIKSGFYILNGDSGDISGLLDTLNLKHGENILAGNATDSAGNISEENSVLNVRELDREKAIPMVYSEIKKNGLDIFWSTTDYEREDKLIDGADTSHYTFNFDAYYRTKDDSTSPTRMYVMFDTTSNQTIKKLFEDYNSQNAHEYYMYMAPCYESDLKKQTSEAVADIRKKYPMPDLTSK